MTVQPKGNERLELLQAEIDKEDWWTKTEKKCKHCKNNLSKYEEAVNLKEWNRRFKHHYCCFNCFQERHI